MPVPSAAAGHHQCAKPVKTGHWRVRKKASWATYPQPPQRVGEVEAPLLGDLRGPEGELLRRPGEGGLAVQLHVVLDEREAGDEEQAER